MSDAENPTPGEHDPRCYQNTGVPDDLPDDLCDCRAFRTIDAQARHGYGETSDCLCGRNFATVRGLREHITKSRVFPPGWNPIPPEGGYTAEDF